MEGKRDALPTDVHSPTKTISMGSSRIGAGPDYMDPLRYRISRSGQTIIFSHWGNELPNFDDVISALDKAEVELEEEVQRRGYDENMGKIRGWNFQTAHVVVRNYKGPDGMNHRELLSFLNGLRLFGQQYGFWTCEMELHNQRYTQRTRGRGVLEVAPPPRAEAVAEA